MMPVPTVVPELYPPAPGVVRERPWWRFDGQDLRRSDGRALYDGKVTELEEYDRLHPLSHPGFRAGQVWVVPDGDQSSVVVLSGDRWAPGWRLISGWMNGHRFALPEAELRQEFAGAILLADPCCPWLAPWSPVAP